MSLGPIDSAPLIIRTYNDDSADNTFLLTRYDYPVSSNRMLLTTSNGTMASSDALVQPSMGMSSITVSTYQGNSIVYSTFYASTLQVSYAFPDTITKTTLTTSSITASTFAINILNIYGMTTSTAFSNDVTTSYTAIGSTIHTSSISFSTLSGDSFITNRIESVSSLIASSIYSKILHASTIVGDTLRFSSITVTDTIATNLSLSAIQGSTIVTSTLIGSTIYSNGITLSTLQGSTLTTSTLLYNSTLSASSVYTDVLTFPVTTGDTILISNINVSLALANSFVFSTTQGSTLLLSTLKISTLALSSNTVSTFQGNALFFSTLTTSSMSGNVVVYSTLQGSTLLLSSMTVSILATNHVSYSTLTGSSVNAIVVTSTLGGSTILLNALTFSTVQDDNVFLSTLYLSTLSLNNAFGSTFQGSTVVASTFVVSSMNVPRVIGSTIAANTLLFSTITASSIYGGSVLFSTLQGSTLSLSTTIFSTLSASTISYSTLQGSTFTFNDVISPVIQSGSILFSTLQVNTSNNSTFTSCTINASNSNVSTLFGSTLITYTLSGSTIISGRIIFSTIGGSSIVANSITALSTFTDNGAKFLPSYLFNNSQISTSQFSTLSVPSILTVSTLYRVNPSSLTYSTLTLAAGLQSNTVATSGLLTCSSITTANINVTRSVINEPVYGQTVKIESIVNSSAVVLKTSGIQATLDAPSSHQQIYTFGPAIPNRWVATADAPNTLVHSNDGFNWLGLGASILGGGRCAVWNGTMWVAVGDVGSYNSIAYSYDGIKWTGTGVGIFTTYGMGVVWNGNLWVAVGGGTNSIAYSYDGINWIGLGTRIFTVYGQNIVWNGTMFVACGNGTNTLAYSYDGIVWTGVGAGILTSYGFGLAWNGTMWVATGSGGNSLAYSNDGIVWYGIGNIYPIIYTVAWNGIMWIAGSDNATHTLLYSYNGMNWFGLGKSIFSTAGRTISWNGTMWVAGGSGTNTVAYSYNGLKWYELGTLGGVITSYTYGVGFNARRPHQITFPASISVATGSGVNTLAYSTNGINWIGLGVGIFSDTGTSVAWNGSMWVATGSGTNTLAYSTNVDTPYIHIPFENSTYADVMGNSTVTAPGSPAFVTGTIGAKAVNMVNTVAYATSTGYINGTWAGSPNFTVSFWFNMTSFIAANGQSILFSAYNAKLLIIIYANSLSIYTNMSGSGTIPISTSAIPLTSTWYYVTYIHQNDGLCSLYLNNSFVGSYTNVGGLGTSTTFAIGANDVNQTTPFNGYIDDFRLYNYAITVNPKITWRGLGTSIFSGQGRGVAWNGSMWVAVGSGTNTIAYSYDGITWIGVPTNVFTQGNGVVWNGFMWVAVGSGAYPIAFSYNGITWTGCGSNVFTRGNGVAWNGLLWIAAGSGTNTISYSNDGKIWTGLGSSSPLFTSSGNGIAWNGARWVAVGSGGNTILYSTNGIVWTAAATSCFTVAGNSVVWNGTRWIATGSGTSAIGYSIDGSIWAVEVIARDNIAITPQLSNLNSNTWDKDGISWDARASAIIAANVSPYHVFNNTVDPTVVWNGIGYSASTGVHTGNEKTFVEGSINAYINGEWVQINSSIPLTIQSYTFACGAPGRSPRIYTIVGSNDSYSWYPIQQCTILQNPFITSNTTCSNYLIANQSGAQTLSTSERSGTVNCIIYSSYTTQSYTYFRIICQAVWPTDNTFVQIGEWYIKFNSLINMSVFSGAGAGLAWNGGLGSATIQHPVIAVGQGTHTLAYSPDGVQWTGLGTSIFSAGYGVAWNGTLWVAVGAGTNTIAYSYDGVRWIGLGAFVFSQGNGIAWNGSLWVAVGNGTNKIAYSTDGMTWIGSTTGNAIFTTSANSVAWNGKQWVAVGQGTNSIAYSADGIAWTAIGSTVFSTKGNGVAWTGSLWVAVGTGTNSIASSVNGINWTPAASSPFTTGNGICWNGVRWLAVGQGTSSIAYSANGTTWTGFGNALFSTAGYGVCWTGTRFVAVGSGTNTMIYSQDGLTWYATASGIFTQGNGVAGNPRIGATVCDSQLVLNANEGGSNTLDIISDAYCNTGYTNFSATIQAQTYASSGVATSLVTKTLPDAPTAVFATLYPSGAATGMNVSFTYPTNVGGGIDLYYVSAIDTNGIQPTVTTSSSISPIHISGLVPGTTYRFTVYSSNSAGQSAATSSVSTLLYQNTPGAPTSVTAALTPIGNPMGVLVSFTPPVNLGGGVSSYIVFAYSGEIMVSSAPGPSSPVIISGLTAGTTYTYSVKATNTGGTSVASTPAPSLKYIIQPAAPTNVSAVLYPPINPYGIRVTFNYSTDAGGDTTLTYYASAVDVSQNGQATVTISSTLSTIDISDGLIIGTTYQIGVYSSNTAGQSASTLAASTLIYQTVPGAPILNSVALTPTGNPNGVLVSFTPSVNTGGGISSYTATAYSGATAVRSVTGPSLSLIINGLSSGTTYTYKVIATNTSGNSAASVNVLSLTYYTKPTEPSVVSIAFDSPTTPTGVNVTFGASSDTGGGILTYVAEAYYNGNFVSQSLPRSSGTLFVTSLTPGDSYTYTIVATNSAVPTIVSDYSVPSALTPYYTQPTAPTNVVATRSPPLDPTGVIVTFNASSDTGGSALTYTATAYINGVATLFTASGSSNTFTFTGLTAGTTYTYIVTATNSGLLTNTSGPSAALTYYTKPIMPIVPIISSVTLQPFNNPPGVNVNFTPLTEASTGGGTLSYVAESYYEGNFVSQSPSSSSSTLFVTSLEAGKSYTYRIVATNVATIIDVPTIVSDYSVPSALTPYYTQPSAPTNVVATRSPPLDPTGVIVTFNASSVTGGSALTYTATAYINGVATELKASGSSNSLTITGLTAGTTYTYIVTAFNGGVTNASYPSSVLTYYTKPVKPIISSVALDLPLTPNGVNVNFTPLTGSSTGGGTLTYTATAYLNEVATSFLTSGPTTPLKITGLTTGTTYTYKLIAKNAAVTSDVSDPATLLYQTNPSVPRSVTASATLNTTTISWVAPLTDGGSAITSYQVVSSPAGYDSGILGVSTLSVVATGLTNGTSYSFTVTARNSGALPASSEPSLSVIPYTTPSEPTGLSGITASGQITLSWTAPTNTGGRVITGYQIINTTTSTARTSPTNSYLWDGLTNGNTYTFTVAATNDGVNYGATVSFNISLSTPGFTYRLFTAPAPILSLTAGAGGYGGGSINNGYGGNGGGGGAGGVIVSSYSPALPAGVGGGGTRSFTYGGIGGNGFGAGGGGAAYEYATDYTYKYLLNGGTGAAGFAYLYVYYTDDTGVILFYSSNNSYTFTKAGSVYIVVMGGGSGGRPAAVMPAYYGRGGNAGYVMTYTVSVVKDQVATITIGAGGGSNTNGGQTSVSINGSFYSAAGGDSTSGSSTGGDVIDTGGQQNAYGMNGLSAGNGGQGTTIFSTAVAYITSRVTKYFSDNPTLFSIWTPRYTGTTTDTSNINLATGAIIPIDSSLDNYSVEWFGYFKAPFTETYTFYTNSNAASYVWFGSVALSGYTTANALVNNGGLHTATEKNGTTSTLTAGTFYPIRCQFGASTGTNSYIFSFSSASVTKRSNLSGYIVNW
jgi:hypothetical protein